MNIIKLDATREKILIFTDLDGTLLDHDTYSFEPVIPLLSSLKEMNIPVIPNTSKTFTEVKHLMLQMKLSGPLIVENGSAVYLPKSEFKQIDGDVFETEKYWVKHFTRKKSHWQSILSTLSEDFFDCYETFSSMSNTRIAELTGLSEDDAKRAAEREFSEPLLWKSDARTREQFIEQAKTLGASPLLGGRFLHLCGDTNKGKAMLWLVNEYAKKTDERCISVSLGDGNNDVDMLESSNIAIRIRSKAHEPPLMSDRDRLYTSDAYGPSGWHEIISKLIPHTTR